MNSFYWICVAASNYKWSNKMDAEWKRKNGQKLGNEPVFICLLSVYLFLSANSVRSNIVHKFRSGLSCFDTHYFRTNPQTNSLPLYTLTQCIWKKLVKNDSLFVTCWKGKAHMWNLTSWSCYCLQPGSRVKMYLLIMSKYNSWLHLNRRLANAYGVIIYMPKTFLACLSLLSLNWEDKYKIFV